MDADFDLDSAIRKVQGFPRPEILFYDVTGILVNPAAFRYCIDSIARLTSGIEFDAVAAIEARGFVFAAPVAERRGVPLILVRKKGKLPGKTLSRRFQLEYGEDEIQVHVEDVKRGSRILVIDDLIATGGTLRAAVDLLREAGGVVTDLCCVIGLPFLKYADLFRDVTVRTLVNYNH